MQLWQTQLAHQLEELHLIQCSLLPGERFAFVLPPEDIAVWSSLLDAFTELGGFTNQDDDDGVVVSLTEPPCQARFEVRVDGVQTWFEVVLPHCTDADYPATSITISVKGEHVSRETHERWTAEIRARMEDMDEGCAFPAYELVTQLTASLHESQASPSFPGLTTTTTTTTAPTSPSTSASGLAPEPPYHALLTSHHLISPTKRRTLHTLSSTLSLTGFAKVGYPGVIYAEGPCESVEAFVREVKGMQWLALRVRFVEPVPGWDADADLGSEAGRNQSVRWVEVSKIGEVLELMRMRGREALVTNLGIGAPSKEPKH